METFVFWQRRPHQFLKKWGQRAQRRSILTRDKENEAPYVTGLIDLAIEIRPRLPNERDAIQGEHRHVWTELFTVYQFTFQITGHVIFMAPGNITDGDIGAFFHQLLFGENEQRARSE